MLCQIFQGHTGQYEDDSIREKCLNALRRCELDDDFVLYSLLLESARWSWSKVLGRSPQGTAIENYEQDCRVRNEISQQCLAKLVKKATTPDQGIRKLVTSLFAAQQAGLQPDPRYVLWQLSRHHPDYAYGMLESMTVNNNGSSLSRYLGCLVKEMPIPLLNSAFGLFDLLLQKSDSQMALGISSALFYIQLDSCHLPVVKRLLAHSDEHVVAATIRQILNVTDKAKAYYKKLLSSIRLNGREQVAQAVCGRVGRLSHSNFEPFTRAAIARVIRELVDIADLDQHEIIDFLQNGFKNFPEEMVDLFLNRIPRVAEHGWQPDFHVLPYRLKMPLINLQLSADQKFRLLIKLLENIEEGNLAEYWYEQLLNALLEPFDMPLLSLLQDWCQSDQQRTRQILPVLEHIEVQFLTDSSFIKELLDDLYGTDDKAFKRLCISLHRAIGRSGDKDDDSAWTSSLNEEPNYGSLQIDLSKYSPDTGSHVFFSSLLARAGSDDS
jgi:hypothetical protein